MLFCHIQVAPFAHENIRYMGIYFLRNFIITTKQVLIVEAIKYLEKYMTVWLILACEKEAIYMWQNSILIFYINTFQRKLFIKFYRRCAFLTPLMLNRTLFSMDFCYWSRLRIRVIGRRVYVFNLYSPFVFQMTGRSNLWIGITVHVNYRLESIAYR